MPPTPGAVSVETATLRSETVAQPLLQAQCEGRPVNGDAAMERALFGPFDSSASRAQVRAEAIEARRLGLLEPATRASVQR